jgi:hypothetical protein
MLALGMQRIQRDIAQADRAAVGRPGGPIVQGKIIRFHRLSLLAKHPRGDLADLIRNLLGGHYRRPPGDIGRAAGVGALIEGREVGIRGINDHILHRYTQHLSRHLGQHGV